MKNTNVERPFPEENIVVFKYENVRLFDKSVSVTKNRKYGRKLGNKTHNNAK
jgi:hypothetical protein